MTQSFAFGHGLAYILGAFIAWDLNPANWDVVGRLGVALMGLAFTAFALIGRQVK